MQKHFRKKKNTSKKTNFEEINAISNINRIKLKKMYSWYNYRKINVFMPVGIKCVFTVK